MYSFLKFSEVSESLSIPAFNSSVRVLPKACLMWFFIRLESAESLWELPHPTQTWITIPTKITSIQAEKNIQEMTEKLVLLHWP